MSLAIYMSCLHALPSSGVYCCVLFGILSYRFVVSIKNLDLDWPLSSWGYGKVWCPRHHPQQRQEPCSCSKETKVVGCSTTVKGRSAGAGGSRGRVQAKEKDCIMRLSNIVGCSMVCVGKNLPVMCALCMLCARCADAPPVICFCASIHMERE